ncbi:MAG: SpoIIE family protein phosphatase [Spirochaetia bacterium]
MNRGARTVEPDSILSQVSFSEFLDQVQDGLYIVDSTRRIAFWNRAAEELTGFPAAQMVGQSCVDPSLLDHRTLLGESLCTDETCPLLRCMTTGISGTVPYLILMKTASGRRLPISLSVGPLHGRDGKGIGAIALFRSMREEYQQRKLAVEIQKRTITTHDFTRNGVRIDAVYAPVDELGGDFLEAFFLDERTLIATVADATGHGISASLFTMVYKTLLHSSFAHHRRPGHILETINSGFVETAGVDGFYIGACLVIYDTVSRQGSYAAAGHPRSLLFSREGDGYRLKGQLGMQSLMLGMNEKARYGELEFELAPGEFLLVSSDGMLESPCKDGSQFGIAGVEAFFAHYPGRAPLDDLIAEVRRKSAFFPLADDVSALLVTPA